MVSLYRISEPAELQRKERDMGVYGIAVLSFFMRYFGNFNFNVRYCGII